MANSFQTLPGFRDFSPRDCAVRNYLFETWRDVARRAGFVEYDTPLLEDTELYLKKSGGELSSQLFRFQDQGNREVTLRPEVTASLARLAIQTQREYPKPMKWFQIGSCFRYEKPQKGRGREFIQFNADILGESSVGADAELIALAIETMLALGFTMGDFVVRISDRAAWLHFAQEHGIPDDKTGEFLNIIDKMEREKPSVLEEKLKPFAISYEAVKGYLKNPDFVSEHFRAIENDLVARGYSDCIALDLSIIRGLAYYTGTVFEIFDKSRSLRAIAGGGRYDDLIKHLSEGAVDLPAIGFAMGDYVIRNFIEETAHAAMQLELWLANHKPSCEVYLVVLDECKRPHALALLTELRSAGIRADISLSAAKTAKQFQSAERTLARFCVIIGSEFPDIQLKNLNSREEISCNPASLLNILKARLKQPDGPLLA